MNLAMIARTTIAIREPVTASFFFDKAWPCPTPRIYTPLGLNFFNIASIMFPFWADENSVGLIRGVDSSSGSFCAGKGAGSEESILLPG